MKLEIAVNMNSIKQEALEKINYEYSGFERLEKIWEAAHSQGVADERANWKDVCEKCRGKGYGSSIFGAKSGKGMVSPLSNRMVFCDCERGKQLEQAVEKEVLAERKRAAGVAREHSCGEIVDTGCPEAIATEIERGV